MTVHVMETPFQMPRPDLKVLAANRAQLQRQAQTPDASHLPFRGEQPLDLARQLAQVDRQVLDTLTFGAGLLVDHGLQELLQTIDGLKRQPLTEQTGSHIDVTVREIRELRIRTLDALREQCGALNDALAGFSTVSGSDVDQWVAGIEATLAQLDAQIAAEDQPLGKWLEEETALNGLIADVEASGLPAQRGPLMALLAETAADHPLAGSIRAGICAMSSILDRTSDSLEYRHLLEHRVRLQALLEALRGKGRELLDKRKVEARRLEQLKHFKALEQSRLAYGQEVAKLLETLNGFLGANRIQAVDNVEAQTAQFIHHARMLSNYLTQLRKDWCN